MRLGAGKGPDREFAEGLDTSTCEVVEIAGVVADTGAKFATVVCPTTLGQSEDAAAVHGITVEELQSAPPFPVAFERFCAFLSASADDALEEVIDTSEGESQDMTPPDVQFPALCSPAPVVVLAAHNGIKWNGMERHGTVVETGCRFSQRKAHRQIESLG